ncbi:MAG: Phasin protein [Halomonas sp. HL-48]|nr:phasin family protein [Halomonas sp. HL-48]KPQ23356.1 MAG: Phasin protein [Halomonas sp. HL-48]
MNAEKMKKENDTKADQATNRTKQKIDQSVTEPLRAYGTLTTDYYEKLFSTQFDTVRALADSSLAQSRSWLDVRDAESFQKVAEDQQQAFREISERLKDDTDKIRSLSQEFLQESKQLAMDNMQVNRKHLEDNMQQGKKQVEDSMQKSKDQAEKSQQH